MEARRAIEIIFFFVVGCANERENYPNQCHTGVSTIGSR
jgi:hypothetical protein